MTLKEWIEAERSAERLVTLGRVAGKLGIAPEQLSRQVNGHQVPHLSIVQLVHILTEGKVSLFDWPSVKKE